MTFTSVSFIFIAVQQILRLRMPVNIVLGVLLFLVPWIGHICCCLDIFVCIVIVLLAVSCLLQHFVISTGL